MNRDIAQRIADLRRERGLNQDELAELCGVHRVTIAKYETGRIEPGAQALKRIADALEVSSDVLLGRKTDNEEEIKEKLFKSIPKTAEARIVSFGMDQLPKEDREQILSVVRAVCVKHPELFAENDTIKRSDANDTKP